MTQRLFGLICLCAAASACLQRGECDSGETRCFTSGSSVEAQYCDDHCSDFGCDPRWTGSRCGASGGCVELPGAGAMCVLSTTPEPRCAGATAFCDGDVRVECRGGYAVRRVRCGTEYGDALLTRCLPFDHETECVPAAAAPDASCPPGRSRYCSAAADLVECVGGEAVFRSACGTCSAGTRGSCLGALGSWCSADAECASGLVCHADALGRSICTTPCTVTTAGDDCFQALGTAGFPYSRYSELFRMGPNLVCAAGYCTWQ